jgi:drug/metabolite transporter (DMT)-like permease
VSNLQLFAACVAIWGSTWLAITFQLGTVAPEASVFYRFLLGSLILFAYCRLRGLSLAFTRREHAWIALQGVFMFGAGYITVYHAERHLVSGLVAVGFSASPLLGMLGQRVFFGTPMTARVAMGSALGILGITCVFWPEFGKPHAGQVALGAALTVASVVLSTLGSLVAHRNHGAQVPIWQSMAWGMLYGALFTAAWAIATGLPFGFEATPGYVLSLLYLSIAGSVLAFGSYLTLLGRIGAARSGYIGVMVPIMALAISAFFEGFRWEPITFAGVGVSVAGNVVILRRT